jgi:hypothetical protein
LRAPWVELKYSITVRPSLKFDVIGRLDDRAVRLGHEAAHAGELTSSAAGEPRAPECAIM